MQPSTPLATPGDILAFWREAGPARWFAKDQDFDSRIRKGFLSTHEAAARGDLGDWLGTAESALPLIILLDQFPRNLFRGLARSFATDNMAKGIAYKAIAKGFDAAFENPLRRFFYLPMMHSEAMVDQDYCVRMCAAADDAEGVKFAGLHRGIIGRFGRFPHRNTVYGRQNTPAEQAFLDEGGFAG